MGSLTTKPKTPVITYASVPQATTAPVVANEATTDAPSDATAQAAEAARRHSLPGTILTSFRGVLSPGDWIPQRKSLLGE